MLLKFPPHVRVRGRTACIARRSSVIICLWKSHPRSKPYAITQARAITC